MNTTFFLLLTATSLSVSASAQLTVVVSPTKVTGQKAVVRLSMKNEFTQSVDSARSAVFLLDQQGQILGQGSHWVIGGDRTKTGLRPGATNTFNFVLQTSRPITSTNLTARVTFNRLVLEGGKLADPVKEVVIKTAPK
jgi:hypothetical protein